MARDHGPFGRRPGADDDTAQINPVDQLDDWRAWRHEGTDTAEFPAVLPDESYERAGRVHGEDLPQPASRLDRLRWSGSGRSARPGRRPGSGVLIGGGLVAAALLLSGLAAVGVGPVRQLLGSEPGHSSSTTGSGGSSHSKNPRSSTSSGQQADGRTSPGPTTGGANTGGSNTGAGTPGTNTPSAPTRVGGPSAPTVDSGDNAGPGGVGPQAPGPGAPAGTGSGGRPAAGPGGAAPAPPA